MNKNKLKPIKITTPDLSAHLEPVADLAALLAWAGKKNWISKAGILKI